MLGSSSLYFLVAVPWRYSVLVILDTWFASLFLGSRFVVDMILYPVVVVVATFHQMSNFFLGIQGFCLLANFIGTKCPGKFACRFPPC